MAINTGIGAAVGVAVGGLTLLVQQSTTTGREIQNLARIANASTKEFQRMSFGAGSLGIEHDKLADILKDVNDRVGDFIQTGGGPMADFFENIAPKVGVTAQQFAKLSGPQALQLFYTSLEKANLSQADMTFYMEAMASDLTALQPLLRNNGQLLQEQGNRAERLGIILSEIELQQLDSGAQSFREMGETIKMAGTLIGASLVPYLEVLTTYQGIAAGVKLGYPAAIPAVAAAAATGLAQIQQIRAQSFGGPGGAAARGQGTPATAPNPVGVGGSTGQQQPERIMHIQGFDAGSLYSGNQIKPLAEALNEFYADGGGKVTFA